MFARQVVCVSQMKCRLALDGLARTFGCLRIMVRMYVVSLSSSTFADQRLTLLSVVKMFCLML